MNHSMVSLPCNASVEVPSRLATARQVLSSLAVLIRDPNRLDQVLVFVTAVNARTMGHKVGPLLASPAWQTLFAERPLIDEEHVDFGALSRLPDGTLGREYVRFLRDNGISPEPFLVGPDAGEARVNYLILRYRQTHDIWHVVTGYKPDVDGELMLQAFTYAQTEATSSLLLVALGLLRYRLHWRSLKRAHAAYRLGKRLREFGPTRWEQMFSWPLERVREAVGASADDIPTT